MTRGFSLYTSGKRRRRLRPAAPLVVPAYTLAFGLLAIGVPDASPSADPAIGRPLPTAALAAERPPVATPAPPPSRRAERRLVDVIDREAPRPLRISIPAIGVSAPVVPLGRQPDQTIETPDDWESAGWYEPGSEPGEQGPAVIVGHVDSTSGPAVFYRLRELRRAQVIRIRRADGHVVRFRVEGMERWPKAEFPTRRVFTKTRVSAMRLVTCSGEFDASTGHYVDNTIVYAVRVPERRLVLPTGS